MSGFQLDTSGNVGPVNLPNGTQALAVTWGHLTPFARGYVEALFAEQAAANRFKEPLALWTRKGFSDLAPATLQRIIGDCERMISRGITDAALKNPDDKGGTFWRLRQAKVYPSFPPLTPDLGDDGLIYFREPNP